MPIELPAIPAGILTLLALLAPYAIAIINRPHWSAPAKKVVSIVVAVVLAVIVLTGYYLYTGDVVPSWPALVLLAILVVQASYSLVTRSTAKRIETATTRLDEV